MKKTKDVFISYKRVDGATIAKELYDKLTEIGYSVFLDTEILQNGKYENAIRQRITASTDFLVIVTPSFTKDENVLWIKKEFEWALNSNSNVIPVYYVDPNSVSPVLEELKTYNGINTYNVGFDKMITELAGKLLTSNQDVTYKQDESKDDLTNIKDYLDRHTARAFMDLALGAEQDNEIADANNAFSLLAQESEYDIITCFWIILHKCLPLINEMTENASPKYKMVESLLRIIEDTLCGYSILIDEGKLDSANRFFPKLNDLLIKLIGGVCDGMLD